MNLNENRFYVSSDVKRDGIGIEYLEGNKIVAEIFRNDSQKTKTVKIFSDSISIEIMEEMIRLFKEKISSDYISE